MSDELVTVIAFEKPEDALAWQQKLADAGIEAEIANDEDPAYAWLLYLQVGRRDVKRAREILKAARPPSASPFHFWDRWMAEMAAGWALILAGILVLLFAHFSYIYGVVIIGIGAVLTVIGFYRYGQGRHGI